VQKRVKSDSQEEIVDREPSLGTPHLQQRGLRGKGTAEGQYGEFKSEGTTSNEPPKKDGVGLGRGAFSAGLVWSTGG